MNQIDKAPYIPTPDEIRDACERIRVQWSHDKEEQRRYGHVDDDDLGHEEPHAPPWKLSPGAIWHW